ncbi:FtsW/RodA/SpoVE family cell cycle protein [Tumebacillus sp. ITR2]|uniref:FtsW/RodA/SpoVE family cell cycle protein n=1 Tax=Tumebacillus amylolyticus TaxID=2801339 RepID=A0ABS1JFM4_9BACL|nr:FtsW/RodA/SpoVE family cell cycle protein [Tumebacillus amylolyticus]MBL0388804.1 FtsW/RodA/SpoVE family cell cycle protein [Tumebacillus amylolyticus]
MKQQYLNRVCEEIRCQEIHDEVRLELDSHLEDLAAEFMLTGVPEQEAMERAISQMGDPRVVGRRLDQVHKPRWEWVLLLTVISLLAFGMLVLYRMGVSQSTSWDVFSNKVWTTLGGLLIGAGLFFYDYRKTKAFSKKLFYGTLMLLLMAKFLGISVNGIPYLNVGFANLNISAYAPLLLVFAMAGIFSEWDWKRRFAWVQALGYFVGPTFLLMMFRSPFPVLEYALCVLVLLLVSKAGWKFVMLYGVVAFVLSAFLTVVAWQNQLVERFTYFLHPYQDPGGMGYQLVQSLEAIKHAGLWGHGVEQLSMLPELETGFVYSYVIFTFGWVGGGVLVALIAVFLMRMFRTVRLIRESYGTFLVAVLTTYFTLHFVWGVFMTLSWLPPAPFSLPFLAHGGAQTILQMAVVGVCLSVYRRKDMIGEVRR